MTNYEWIKSLTEEDMTKFLCAVCSDCNQCIAYKYCSWGNTGFYNWLKAEQMIETSEVG